MSAAVTGQATKYVYTLTEGDREMRDLLGGKGANLCEMARLGLPVPPAFIVTTDACRGYMAQGEAFLESLTAPVQRGLEWLEQTSGKRFGDPVDPLLVSVRSGAAVSMPGMMDTILNLGLNDATVAALAEATGDPRFAFDCYRRFLQMYGEVVLGIDRVFDRQLNIAKRTQGVVADKDLSAQSLELLCRQYKQEIQRATGVPFPEDPRAQLLGALRAVFRSWNADRARTYRQHEGISDSLGTAVNVQAMVFGNKGERSASGVAFSRDPATGAKLLYGEYLTNAQGEDVVAGIRTPQKVERMAREMPDAYAALSESAARLEAHYKDVQDIEFTIEEGTFYLLQTRVAARTAQAALRIAVDLVADGVIDEDTALLRLEPSNLETLLHPTLDESAPYQAIAKGLPASPGAAVGQIVFSAPEAVRAAAQGRHVILVREETRPDDIDGMIAAEGILTSQGGMTSHAAVVARGMGKPCISGCDTLHIDETAGTCTLGGRTLHRDDILTLNGSTGEVILGALPTRPAAISDTLQTVLEWADARRTMKVRTNADTAEDTKRAVAFGAEGIGLCRTEHMFLGERSEWVADLILLLTSPDAPTHAQLHWKNELLAKLRAAQKEDFIAIFRELEGRPCNIRLIDPPLHEFLPSPSRLTARLDALGLPTPANAEERSRLITVQKRLHEFSEENPMLGFRGVRLGVIYPEINQVQIEAICEAALEVKRAGIAVRPEIMIPLVAEVNEFTLIRKLIEETAARIFAEAGEKIEYQVGTMIEIPRAALTAGAIAAEAEFFSFGTNDLTQTTYGISRDDAEAKFLRKYVERRVLPYNPFQRIDEAGVGRLMRIAVDEGRAARPSLKVGICGEQGGDPRSVQFCQDLGLDYVSCSPFRVPVARLAAAQAALRRKSSQSQ